MKHVIVEDSSPDLIHSAPFENGLVVSPNDSLQHLLKSQDILPLIIKDTIFLPWPRDALDTRIVISSKNMNHLVQYIKLAGDKKIQVVLTFENVKDNIPESISNQKGFLVNIQSLSLDKDEVPRINIVYDRMVQFSVIESSLVIAQEKQTDSNTYCKIKEVKYRIDDTEKLSALIKESFEIVRKKEYASLYNIEWNKSLERNIQYLVKISEMLLYAISTGNNPEKLWEILSSDSLNRKFELIVELLRLQDNERKKDLIESAKQKNKAIAEVSVVPEKFKVVLFTTEIHKLLPMSQLSRHFTGNEEKLSAEQVEKNFYNREQEIILTSESIWSIKPGNSLMPAIIGDVKYVNRQEDCFTYIYVMPKSRVRLTEIVVKEGVFYGKTEEIKELKVKNQEELQKLQNLTESVIKASYAHSDIYQIPVFIPEVQDYETYAANTCFYIAENLFNYDKYSTSSGKQRINEEFYSYNTMEKLFYLKEYFEALNSANSIVETKSNEQQVQELIDRGKTKLQFSSCNTSKYAAIKDFNQAILLKPEAIQEIGLLLAETYRSLFKRNETEIVAIYDRISIKDSKTELEIAKEKARAHFWLKKYRESINSYNKAILLGLSVGEVEIEYQVESYLKLGMEEKAIEIYDNVISSSSDRWSDNFYRIMHLGCKANILAGLKRFDKAVTCYQESLDLYLKLPEPKWGLKLNIDLVYINYAIALQAAKRKNSRKFLNIALERIETTTEENFYHIYLFLKAILLAKFGRLEESERCYDKIKIFIESAQYEFPQIEGWLEGNLAVLKMYYGILELSDHLQSYLLKSYINRIWGKHEEEKICLEKILELKPEHAYALSLLGIACAKLDQLEKAASYFEKAIKYNGTDKATEQSRKYLFMEAGKTLARLGKYKEALEYFRQTVNYDNKYVNALLACGEMLTRLNQDREALEYIEKALLYNAYHIPSYIRKSELLLKQIKYREALECCEQGLLLSVYNTELLEIRRIILLRLAQTTVLSNDDILALENELLYLDRTLEHSSDEQLEETDYGKLHRNRGELLYRLDRTEEALEAYEESLKYTSDSKTYEGYVYALYKLKKFAEATAACDKVLASSPDISWCYVQKGNILVQQGGYEQAWEVFKNGMGQCPSDIMLKKETGDILQKLGKNEEALVIYENLIEQNLPDADCYIAKGNILVALQRYVEATEAYEKAAELDPCSIKTLGSLASLLSVGEYHEKAVEFINKALDVEPENVELLMRKGSICYNMKKYDEAVKCYDNVLQLSSNNHQEAKRRKEELLTILLDTDADSKNLEYLINNIPLSSQARTVALQKFQLLKTSSEISKESDNNSRYLRDLLKLPWGRYDISDIDFRKAKEELENNHFGLDKVKSSILEALVFMARSKEALPPILCLVGAPGVGKTSIALSIAKALQRKTVKLSLAGANDSGLIRGCMSYYSGATPGKVMSLLSEAGTCNPVMILDEIDKIDHAKDKGLEGALLQLIDPSQNHNFTDDYFNFPFDMSKVLFIITANSLDNISYPLQHRMEIIELTGYTDQEKGQITENYILPKILKEANLTREEFNITNDIIKYLITDYTRESGVRDIERLLRRLVQKYLVAKLENHNILLDIETVEKYLGGSIYTNSQYDDITESGTAFGLAYTARGGGIIRIEVEKCLGKGNIKSTGKLGEILKESVEAAYTYLKSHCRELNIKESEFAKYDLHVHFPEGATPKDGPSAGITIYTAIASLLSDRKVKTNIAMTGEITLKGKVLPIGGLKEKLTAALREGKNLVIIPEGNKKDLKDIPDEIKNSLTITTISYAKELLDIVFLKPD